MALRLQMQSRARCRRHWKTIFVLPVRVVRRIPKRRRAQGQKGKGGRRWKRKGIKSSSLSRPRPERRLAVSKREGALNGVGLTARGCNANGTLEKHDCTRNTLSSPSLRPSRLHSFEYLEVCWYRPVSDLWRFALAWQTKKLQPCRSPSILVPYLQLSPVQQIYFLVILTVYIYEQLTY